MLTSRLTTGRLSVRWTRTSAATASGAPTQKHHRQPSHSVSTMRPPISGPATGATDMTVETTPV